MQHTRDRAQRLAVGVVLAFASAACSQISPDPQPTAALASAAEPSPLTPADVEARLRTLDPDLRLVANATRDESGAFPTLVFDARTTPTAVAPAIGRVLVYPTTAARTAAQPAFGPSQIAGPEALVEKDGIVHSEWIGIDNALVEAVMPGGTMGGRSATPDEARFPDQVRRALEGP